MGAALPDSFSDMFVKSTPNDFNPAYILFPLGLHGDRSTYEDVGLLFDTDTPSKWDSVKAAMAPFLYGQVVPDGYTVIDGQIVALQTF